MANTTRSANAYKQYNGSNWGSWRSLSGGDLVPLPIGTTNYPAWRYNVGSAVRITQISFQLGIDGSGDIGYPYSLTASLYKDDPATGSPVATDTQTFSLPDPDPVTFTFQSLTLDTTSNFYIVVKYNRDPAGGEFIGDARSATITYSAIPALTPSIVQPRGGSIGVGTDTLFSWQSSGAGTQTAAELQWSSNGSTWQSLATISGNGQTWQSGGKTFPQGTTYWRIRLTSSYGVVSEWVQESFTTVYNPAVVTLTTPMSGSVPGGAGIMFAWTIAAGSGTVTGVQLQYSDNEGVSWTTLLSSSKEVTSYLAAAGTFPAGSLRWRVRAKNSYAGWGDWKQATVTVTYDAAVVTLTAPTSGTKDGSDEISFAWTIAAGSGTVTGTQLQISRDEGITWETLVDASDAVTSYKSAAGQFTAGALRWRVRAKNSYVGYSDSGWKQANITIKYDAPSVTLTAPTSGTQDGSGRIHFAWTLTKGSGDIDGVQLQASYDSGITWETLLDAGSAVTDYWSAVAQFPAGALRWRVRAKDQYTGYTEAGWKAANITVSYNAVSSVIPVNSPTSGRVNAAAAQTFQVALQESAPVYTPFTIASASLFWRAGSSGEYTEAAMTSAGATASVTIPAGTFPSGSIEWYAQATDNTGNTTQTAVFTISTLNAIVEALPLSPINTIESGSGPIVLRWAYDSLDGSAQSRADLRYSSDEETWTSLPSVGGNTTQYSVPAGTFSAGSVYWQVRAYNSAGTAGPWSASASFVAFAATHVTGVTGDGKPFLTIKWQAEGQLAYRIMVDRKIYGPYFGETVRSFTLPEPISDGTHTVQVSAQNKYGLWSEWTSAYIDVTNVPGAIVPIGATDGVSVELSLFLAPQAPVITEQPQDLQTNDPNETLRFRVGFMPSKTEIFHAQAFYRVIGNEGNAGWLPCTEVVNLPLNENGFVLLIPPGSAAFYSDCEFRIKLFSSVGEVYTRNASFKYASPTEKSPLITGWFPSETGYFLIYRDGALIGKTYDIYFTDRVALGEHEYTAIQVLPDGYYTQALPDPVTGTASVDCPMIAPLRGGPFVPLKLSSDADRAQIFTRRREVAYTHYAGARYPSAEIGEHETLSGSFDAAWLQKDKAAADAFEEMVGAAVILKTPGGKVIVGVLEGYDLNDPRFYKSYRCTLQQMDWRDFVDEKDLFSV